FVTSGIRLGTAALTTRGFGIAECQRVAGLIADRLEAIDDEAVAAQILGAVAELTAAHPLYEGYLE
ncbi:MAG TPA: serine hydroxymethyltransferase, partial [Armatimonadetes bacterium]|nr:serine hydroxymethyltransferase [Armatimonadota bacterium]